MTKLTIEIPEKAEKTFCELVILLGGKIVDRNLRINSDERKLTRGPNEIIDFRELDRQKDIAVLNENLDAIVFMKYGYHATEHKDKIIKRKKLEFKETGVMFWGYGGHACHPEKQVQQFVRDMHSIGKKVFLAMAFTKSKSDTDGKSSSQYSVDREKWTDVPQGIKVTGSKHAIVCSELFDCDITINLNDYKIAVGRSKGNEASNYIKGQSDKGCLIKSSDETSDIKEVIQPKNVRIKLLAEIVEPFAVFMA